MKRKAMTAIVHTAVVSSDESLSVEEIAGELDKRPSTLYNELNPFGEGPAKLGLDDAHNIMCMASCSKLVEAMAADLGLTVSRLPNPNSTVCVPLSGETVFKELADVTEQAGQLVTTIKKAMDNDGKFSKDELTAIFEVCHSLHREVADIASGACCHDNVTPMKQAG